MYYTPKLYDTARGCFRFPVRDQRVLVGWKFTGGNHAPRSEDKKLQTVQTLTRGQWDSPKKHKRREGTNSRNSCIIGKVVLPRSDYSKSANFSVTRNNSHVLRTILISRLPHSLVHLSLSGNSASYLADDCRLVADARERRLRSTESRTCVVIRTHTQHLWWQSVCSCRSWATTE